MEFSYNAKTNRNEKETDLNFVGKKIFIGVNAHIALLCQLLLSASVEKS